MYIFLMPNWFVGTQGKLTSEIFVRAAAAIVFS
jgi:hypothetical protein